MNDLNDMVIFSKVAELQGISPAARALKMPKSKVSRRMASLEDELGVRLLERSTRSVHLTEIGKIYYQHCQRIVEEAASARDSVNQMLESPRGHLRISTSVTLGQHLLAPYFGEFIANYPQVELEINLNNRRVDVIAEGYDLVIRVGELQDSSLISKRLYTTRAVLYASPAYLERRGMPASVDELKHHQVLVMSEFVNPTQWTFIGPDKQQETVAVTPYLTTNDFTLMRQLAIDGAGIILLPDYLGAAAETAGELSRVLPAWHSPPFSYYAIYPSQRGMTLKLRALLDFLTLKLAKPL